MQDREHKPSRTKKNNNWEPLKTQTKEAFLLTALKTLDETTEEIIGKDNQLFSTKKNLTDGQKWFYSFKVNDLYFLNHRRHYEFLATSMLPVGVPIGLATFDYLDLGPSLCYKQNTKYLAGWNRDVNSTAHIDDMKKANRETFLKNKCATGNDAIGRRSDETDLSQRKQGGQDGYDIWLQPWLSDDDAMNTPKRLYLSQYNGMIAYSGVFTNWSGEKIIIKNQKTNIPAPSPFTIGLLGSKKEDILNYAAQQGHYTSGYGNRAKLRETAEDLYSSITTHARRLEEALKQGKPIKYTTKGGKIRFNAGDYRFYLQEHVSMPGVARNSLKYNETFIEPKHLNSVSHNALTNHFDLSDLSHLVITEGIIGKSSLGNALWNVSMQYFLLKKYNTYLPIHIYNQQTGQHIRVPEENLKFLYALWYALPYLTQEQLDKHFFNLLDEDKHLKNKYSALLDPTKIQEASNKILTKETLEKARRAGDKNAITAIQKYMPTNTLITKKENTMTLRQKLDQEINLLISNKYYNDIQLLLKNLTPEEIVELKQNENIDKLRNIFLSNKQYSVLALLDKQLGEWGKSYNKMKPAQMAAVNKQWGSVLEIAGYKGGSKYFAELGCALMLAAQDSKWDVVEALIKEHKITHLVWFSKEGYYALHYAVLENRIDMLELLIKNTADINSHKTNGKTPLFLALTTPKCEEAAKFLLQNGADYNISYRGESLIELDNVNKMKFDVIEYILKYASLPLTEVQANKLLIKLVQSQKAELAQLLLEKYSNKISATTKTQILGITQAVSKLTMFRENLTPMQLNETTNRTIYDESSPVAMWTPATPHNGYWSD